jgi:hypothetical protein
MNELLKALTDFLKEATVYLGRQNGVASATLSPVTPPPAPPEVKEAVIAKRAARKQKEAPVEPPAASPFGVDTAAGGSNDVSKLSPEDALEAGRRGQEVMGMFIRRHLKASPSGLEMAVGIIEKTLGKPRNPAHVHPQSGAMIWKLEEIKPEEWLKLTPIFEAELDKAA